MNLMKSYLSIFSLLERVPNRPGDCGLYFEIGVILITEITGSSVVSCRFFFLYQSSFLLIVLPVFK